MSGADPKQRVLFICTHNSARSQMAEGLTNALFGDRWQAFSAGTEKTSVKRFAMDAMAKINVDISHHTSKTLDEFLNQDFDLVVTVCDSAKEACPYFPGAKQMIHAGFEDPSDVKGSDSEKLQAFINTRDRITLWLENNLVDYE